MVIGKKGSVSSCIKFTIPFPACWLFLRGLRLNYAKCCWQLLHPQDIHIDSITTLSKSHTQTRLKRKSKQRKNNMLVIHEKDMDVKDTPMPKIEKKNEKRKSKRNETSKLKRKRKRIKNATIEFKCLGHFNFNFSLDDKSDGVDFQFGIQVKWPKCQFRGWRRAQPHFLFGTAFDNACQCAFE